MVRAQPREEMERLVGLYAATSSYGGAKLEGSTVFIDVNRSVFVGWQALNDAELHCFLGHELIHAYAVRDRARLAEWPRLWLSARSRRTPGRRSTSRKASDPGDREDLAFTLQMYGALF